MGKSKLERFLWIFGRPIHPVRAAFAITGFLVFTLPFFVFFIKGYRVGSYFYLLYPLLFLIAHLVWFRLPFVKKRTRWLLFWLTLSVVISLGIGFLVTLTRTKNIESWLTSRFRESSEESLLTVIIWIFFPSAAISASYSILLLLALKLYRKYRKSIYRSKKDT